MAVEPVSPRHRNLHIACSEEDERWLKDFREQVLMLAGLVAECVDANPVTLLSPLHRKILVEQAQKVQDMEMRIAGLDLFVDNLGEPLESR
ncbi:MAG TPA: hypothetical protein VF708_19880 [Pyrinomonadaceae bacterium]|jgi:hypothetical protein